MEFIQALRKIYENNAFTERICDPFYVYCVLSDLCYSDFEEARMVKVYYAVNCQINVFKTLIQNGVDEGNRLLKSYINELAGVEYNDYKRCVIATTLAIQPDYEFSKKSARKPVQQTVNNTTKQSAADEHKVQTGNKHIDRLISDIVANISSDNLDEAQKLLSKVTEEVSKNDGIDYWTAGLKVLEWICSF